MISTLLVFWSQANGTTGSRLFPANIDYDLTITINEKTGEIDLSGTHDGYPSYKVEVNGKEIYDHQQGKIMDLFGDDDTKVKDCE